jgi:uncharacterized phage protein (TIGR01671 family)
MREFKFRAWDKKNKKMYYKLLLGNHDPNDENYTASCVYSENQWKNFDEHSQIEIMQDTGGKDENGKAIYQGDIFGENLEDKKNIFTAKIYWDKDLLSFCVEKSNGSWDYLENYLNSHIHPKKIIGNIFENPDILQ